MGQSLATDQAVHVGPKHLLLPLQTLAPDPSYSRKGLPEYCQTNHQPVVDVKLKLQKPFTMLSLIVLQTKVLG